MKFGHALGFLLFGSVFGVLPHLVPGLCPATGVDGSSAREIWLQLMSVVQLGIALRHLGPQSWRAMSRLVAWAAQPRVEPRPYPVLAASRRTRRLSAAVEGFSAALLEQQRAV